MDLLFALIFSFTLLLFSAIRGIFIAYPLLCAIAIITIVLIHRGFSVRLLLKLSIQGSQKAIPVFSILLLIGALTAVWIAAGTVPVIVYYGIQLINPRWFVLAAFLLTSLVSLLIGTSFGAVGTIGLALMIMAKGSTADAHLIAGAIIAGAYVGDRCSPMSSSAHLIATITRTDLYTNLKNMIRTGALPFAVACLFYSGFSWFYPVQAQASLLQTNLAQSFDLNPVVLLPALTILVLSLLRVEAKRSMLISIVIAVGLAVAYQHYSLWQVGQFALLGFQLDANTPIKAILLGGGMASMAKVCLIVILSTAIAGMLGGTHSLQVVQRLLDRAQSRAELFLGTTLIGIAAVAFGCTQTIGILLTEQLVRQKYGASEITSAIKMTSSSESNNQLALDLENTVVVIAPLIPWNIAGLVPATVLMTDWQFIPYAFYLYLIPVIVLLQARAERKSANPNSQTDDRF